jgi:hypothetical protein
MPALPLSQLTLEPGVAHEGPGLRHRSGEPFRYLPRPLTDAASAGDCIFHGALSVEMTVRALPRQVPCRSIKELGSGYT